MKKKIKKGNIEQTNIEICQNMQKLILSRRDYFLIKNILYLFYFIYFIIFHLYFILLEYYFYNIKIYKTSLKSGDIRTKKLKFCSNYLIDIDKVITEKIVITNKIPCVEKASKYFIGTKYIIKLNHYT